MLLTVLAVAVLAQAAAPAAEPAPAAAQAAPAKAAEPAKPPKPTKVCHDETPIGSIIATRVCRTVKQTDAERQQSSRESDALADHLAACRGAPSC